MNIIKFEKFFESKHSLDEAISFTNFMGTQIYRVISISVLSNSVTLNVIYVGSEKIKKMILTKDSFKFDGEDAWFFSHYVKSSKFQNNVYLSKNLFDILKKYAPNICPPFITPKTIQNLGWDITRDEIFYAKNASYNLYDNNTVRFNKGDKILLLSFNELKAKIFEITDNDNILLEEFDVRTEKDLNRLKNL